LEEERKEAKAGKLPKDALDRLASRGEQVPAIARACPIERKSF